MYEIKYGSNLIHLNSMEEVIEKITDISNDCKQHEAQMLIIKFNNIKIEVGVGDKLDRVVLIFCAKSDRDDTMLSFNEEFSESNVEFLFYRKNSIHFECKEYNLIPLNIALTELNYMFSNNCLSKAIKWYSL